VPGPAHRLDLGVAPSALLAHSDFESVVATPGSLRGMSIGADGTLRQTWQSPIPSSIDPSALGGGLEENGHQPLEVLDRAGAQIVLLKAT
jgi:hypothetical protein